jgi:release factor glutamine methyltransferase
VTATIGTALDRVAAALAAGGVDEPRRRARRLIAAALQLSPLDVLARPERAVAPAAQERIADMMRRTLAREPLSRVAGTREFWGLEFRLSADALDPRPETETVVEAALARLCDRQRRYRLLDLGTGSGCLLLALLAELRHGVGLGIDIAPGAAATARENARRLGQGARARFAVSDWAAAVAGRFDAVLANPPYIASAAICALPREVRDYDPHRALDGGRDGLAAYRAIAADLPRLLPPGGLFATEIGAGQSAAVAAILCEAGLRIDAVVPDLAGIPRCIVAVR